MLRIKAHSSIQNACSSMLTLYQHRYYAILQHYIINYAMVYELFFHKCSVDRHLRLQVPVFYDCESYYRQEIKIT